MLLRRLCSIILVALFALLTGADWLQFRGNDSTSVTGDQELPIAWSATENVAWKAPLVGRGVSGPIVAGGRVIVTASSGFRDDRLHVLCFAAETGKLEWERQFWATGRTLHHPTSAVAAPTPATDGRLVFAFFSSNDLVCLDLDGNLKWLRGFTSDFPTAANDVGMASSPIVVGETVVAQVENPGESFAVGLNKATGETRWQVPRKQSLVWSSPCVLSGPGGDSVILQSLDKLTAHDPLTGRERWSFVAACDAISSPTARDGRLYVPSGGLTALQPPAGNNSAPTILWQESRLGPSSPSVVVAKDKIYIINRAGVLACATASGGEILWQLRVTGTYWATPVLAGSRLYCVNENGVAQTVDVSGAKGEVLATHDFGEQILGSPAVADGALYFRSDKWLWKIRKQ